MAALWRDVARVIRAVWRHWVLVMTGAVSALFGLVNAALGWSVPTGVFVVLASTAIVVACFRAWRDVRRELDDQLAAHAPKLTLVAPRRQPHHGHEPDGSMPVIGHLLQVGVLNRGSQSLRNVGVRVHGCEPPIASKVLIGVPLPFWGHEGTTVDVAPSDEPHVFVNVAMSDSEGWRVLYGGTALPSYDTNRLTDERVLTLIAHAEEGASAMCRFAVKIDVDGSIRLEALQ